MLVLFIPYECFWMGKGNNINETRHNAEKSYIKNKETNTEVIYLVSNNSETILSEINAKKRRILK